MRLGVLQAGRVRGELAAEHGEYPPMFEAMLRPAAPALAIESFPVLDGAFPDSPEACDAWLVTGSRHGVYDDLPWIPPLETFLRAARAARRPIIGVCFGHQILAQAFGGRAEKNPAGWRLGVHHYETPATPGWAAGLSGPLALHTVHQDYVSAIPSDATVWATSPGSAYAGLIYGDPERPDAISLQPHPEFEPGFAHDLIAYLRDQGRVDRETGDAALAGVGGPVDNAAVARAFAGYLRRAAA